MSFPEIDRRQHPSWMKIDLWSAYDGWPLRRFSVDPIKHLPSRGSLLFQTGRADFLEKYIETFAHWRAQGWHVEGFDWRGQGGSGRMLEDRRIGHCASYRSMTNDLAAYVTEWRQRTSAPHILVGHSMGGHLVLRYLLDHQKEIDGAVLLSPMLGIDVPLIGERIGRWIARLACRLGYGERPVWVEKESGSGHRQRNLTHGAERYADELWWRKQDRMLDMGPPTWGWMAQSWSSISQLKRSSALDRIKMPILILYAEQDRLVRAEATRSLARRLVNATAIGHPTAAHELLREADDIRDWALAQVDAFIDHIGTDR